MEIQHRGHAACDTLASPAIVQQPEGRRGDIQKMPSVNDVLLPGGEQACRVSSPAAFALQLAPPEAASALAPERSGGFRLELEPAAARASA